MQFSIYKWRHDLEDKAILLRHLEAFHCSHNLKQVVSDSETSALSIVTIKASSWPHTVRPLTCDLSTNKYVYLEYTHTHSTAQNMLSLLIRNTVDI